MSSMKKNDHEHGHGFLKTSTLSSSHATTKTRRVLTRPWHNQTMAEIQFGIRKKNAPKLSLVSHHQQQNQADLAEMTCKHCKWPMTTAVLTQCEQEMCFSCAQELVSAHFHYFFIPLIIICSIFRALPHWEKSRVTNANKQHQCFVFEKRFAFCFFLCYF